MNDHRKLIDVAKIILLVSTSLLGSAAYADDFGIYAGKPNGTAAATTNEKLTAVQYYDRGTKASADKDYESAVRDLTEAIRMNPKYGEAYGNRGAARFNLHDYQGALSDYNEALKFFPNNKALLDLKVQAENAMKEAEQPVHARPAINPAMMGGDFADPSTMIMRNAQQRGMVPAGVDYSDPASIIMENARRRGLVPAGSQ